MAKLADASLLKSDGPKSVPVRFRSSAPFLSFDPFPSGWDVLGMLGAGYIGNMLGTQMITPCSTNICSVTTSDNKIVHEPQREPLWSNVFVNLIDHSIIDDDAHHEKQWFELEFTPSTNCRLHLPFEWDEAYSFHRDNRQHIIPLVVDKDLRFVTKHRHLKSTDLDVKLAVIINDWSPTKQSFNTLHMLSQHPDCLIIGDKQKIVFPFVFSEPRKVDDIIKYKPGHQWRFKLLDHGHWIHTDKHVFDMNKFFYLNDFETKISLTKTGDDDDGTGNHSGGKEANCYSIESTRSLTRERYKFFQRFSGGL